MTKRWIGPSMAAVVLALSASAGFACDQDAKAADAKDPKEAKDVKVVAAKGETKGCDMPCCAHAKDAGAGAPAAAEVVAANGKPAANAAGEKPCAGHDAKGCPKKAGAGAAVANAEPAKDQAKGEPAADPGTHR